MFKKIIILLILNNYTYASDFIVVQSTTSTADSGFYDYIIPEFKKKSGFDVRVVAVGTGQAIKNAMNGDGDMLIVHSEDDEVMFMKYGYGILRTPLMYNEFIIVGPKNDPENLKNLNNINEVFKKIKEKKLKFITRGDNSGTHKREMLLWKNANIDNRKLSPEFYIDSGRGMGATLNMAASLDAYTITDRGTWLSFGNKQDLDILFSGDKSLFNQYSIILINPEIHPHIKHELANIFLKWLTSDEGQKLISQYKKMGQQLFIPNAK